MRPKKGTIFFLASLLLGLFSITAFYQSDARLPFQDYIELTHNSATHNYPEAYQYAHSNQTKEQRKTVTVCLQPIDHTYSDSPVTKLKRFTKLFINIRKRILLQHFLISHTIASHSGLV